MAPLNKAMEVNYTYAGKDGLKVYKGNVDREWTFAAVANGGYSLALVVNACLLYQASTTHKDPIHVIAHFLKATSVGPFEVHVHMLKKGRSFSNIIANLVQNGSTRITSHIIFGVLAPFPTSSGLGLTLSPPSGYARRLPLYTYPSPENFHQIPRTFISNPHMKWSQDSVILAKNKPDSVTRTSSKTIGGGGLEWGAWLHFVDSEDIISPSFLTFLVDVFVNTPSLLPKSERAGLKTSWFPTMTMTIEFKHPIPTSSDYARRTVAVYSSGQFINDPQGRHDGYVEIWTAPEGVKMEGWRDKQVCLAVSTQMALTVPMEVNHSIGQKGEAKL